VGGVIPAHSEPHRSLRHSADRTQNKSRDPKVFGQRLKERKESGFTWLKMDLGINLVTQTPGTVTRPEGIQQQYGGLPMEHMFMTPTR